MRTLLLVVMMGATACGGTDQALTDGGSDASTGNDGTTSNDGNPGNDGSSANDGSTTNDGGDGSTTLNDAGNPTTIPCGTTSCSGGQVCCVDTNQNTTTFTCAATCSQNATTLKCVGNDCGSQVCCVFIDQNNQTASQCQATCTQNEAQLCQALDGGTTGCTSNAPCSSKNIGDWGLTPPFGTCGGLGN